MVIMMMIMIVIVMVIMMVMAKQLTSQKLLAMVLPVLQDTYVFISNDCGLVGVVAYDGHNDNDGDGDDNGGK